MPRTTAGETIQRLGFNRINVGGFWYCVSCSTVDWAAYSKQAQLIDGPVPGQNNFGMVSFRHAVIMLNPGQANESLRGALGHEISHALLLNAGGFTKKRGKDEEWLADVLGCGWAQVLRDNPLVVKFLQRKAP